MVFSSLIFLYGFLPLSLIIYYFCADMKAQNTSLLIFSLIFYAWGEPKYVLLLIFMSLVSWFCALRTENAPSDRKAKLWVIIAAAADISLIGFFKYAGFFCSIFGTVPDFVKNIALPIGISFYTFQLLTYVVDIYRGEAHAQKSFFNVLLYASLFHQCIAGPIVRYKTVAEELFVRRSSEDILSGIRRFSVGLAKKTLLANPCGALADSLLLTSEAIGNSALLAQNIEALSSLTVLDGWVGLAAYTLQIYFDFSAYSDMAIGMGRMLGLHYLENFDYPYISRSVTEFWRRWHISLGTFFRDYVYIPLGGSRCSGGRMLFNLFAVWALTGLWHGASWNFVLWGLYYFVLQVIEKLLLDPLLKKQKVLPHIYTMLAVYFGWALFRFTDMRLLLALLRTMFGLNGSAFSDFVSVTVLENNMFLLIAAAVCSTDLLKRLTERLTLRARERGGTALLVWDSVRTCVVPVILLLLSTCALVGDSYNPFIYFRF